VLHEGVRIDIGGKLAIAVKKTLGDALAESIHEFVGVDDLHNAFELGAWHQMKLHARNDAEQAIAADRKAKEFTILGAAAGSQVPVPIHDRESLNIADKRSQPEAAAVNVGRKGAAERQLIRPGLLLNDTPWAAPIPLHGDQAFDELGPLNSRIRVDDAALRIEAKPALHRRVSIITVPLANC